MSNRDHIKQPDGSVIKVYVSREERRRRRNERRAKLGSPPEVKINLQSIGVRSVDTPFPKSYNKVTQLVDQHTGEAIAPPTVVQNGNTTFLLDGVKHAWDGMGGAQGFLTWAVDHPTKFYELSMKLVPHQVNVQTQNLGGTVNVIHSLAPPNYDPHKTKEKAIKEVDADAVLQALRALDEDERAALLAQLK